MSKLSKKFKTYAKRTASMAMVGLMTATGINAGLLISDNGNTTVSAASNVLSNEERGVIYANSRTDFRDESIYFLITTRFYDGDPSNNTRTSDDEVAHNAENDPSWRGDFKGLIDKLDYIKALGFTAIWITPVVENKSGYDYHGYHAYDFSAVDKRYESNGITYQDLIDACHAKGMKIIQDVVLNHTCNWGEKNLLKIDNPVYEGGRSEYMMPAGAALDPENIYHHNGYCGGGDFDNYEAQNKAMHGDCFDLETENPRVYNYLVDCYTNYINMGVDAFRVDTVKHISRLTLNSVFVPAFKEAGGDNFYMFGEVCTKGHDVWYREHPPISCAFYTWAEEGEWANCWTNDLATNESLVERHYTSHNDMGSQPTSDNAFLNGNDYHTPDYSKRSGMDVIDFQMHWSFDNANSAFGTALGQDKFFNDSTWNVVYVDSHDYGPDNSQEIRYPEGTDAWAENMSLMFTFRGIPCIYYGSEIEFQAGQVIDKGPRGGPLANTGRAYFGDHIEGTVTSSDFTVFGNVSGEVSETLNAPLSQHLMRLNRIRQAIPALRKGQYSTEDCSGNMAFKRRYTDSSTDSFALVAISGSATFSNIPNGKYVDAVTGDVQNVSNGTLTANVSGKGNMKVYVLDTAKTPAPGRVIPNGQYLTDGGAVETIGAVSVQTIQPTGITLDKTSVTVQEAETAKVTATVAPANATNKNVTWTSSNTAVATVSGGTITGVSKGTATITAKTSNGLTATVNVKVTENTNIVRPTGITLNKTSLTITAGNTDTITATVTPSNATNRTVTWTSSNTSVATVSGGTITAVSEGTATITAKTSNGLTATATVTVEGRQIPTINNGVYFEKPSGWGSNINVYLFSNDTTVGAAWPGTAMTDLGDGIYGFEYQTTDPNLEIIFNDGNNQTADFKYVNNGYYNQSGYVRTVNNETVDPTGITLNETEFSLSIGETKQLTATVTPSNATNKTVTWTSSDPSSVSVSSTGLVTAIADHLTVFNPNAVTITATTSNGLTATATVGIIQYTPTLTNNSTISATSITLGSSITAKGAATGGTSPYQYAFYYKRTSSSSWTTVQSYNTKSTATIKPAAATTYDICIKVKDANGTIEKKYFTLNVKTATTALKNNSTISATSITLGSSITAKGTATGGTSPYQYAYYYKKTADTKWTEKKDFSATTSVSIKPSAATTYDVCIKVKDAKGTVEKKYFTLTVKANTSTLKNNSTLSSSSISLGTTVTAKGAATGGTSPYKYAYYYKRNSSSSWTTIQDYSTNTSATFRPLVSGTYDVCIKVKDNSGNIEKKYFTLKVTESIKNNSTISATSITLGSSITAKGAATGGTSPYQYAYYYKKTADTKWTEKKGFSTTTSVSIKPAAATKYDVCIKVKDAKGTVEKKYFTLTVKAATTALTNNSTISATSITLGSSITAKGAATGGTSPYQYAYYYKKTADTKWTEKKDFSTTTSVSIKPAHSTKYDVCIKVKDAKGTVEKKYFTLTVKAATTALTNNSTISATSITLGSSITAKGAAIGGTSPYQYAYYYKKTADTKWTEKKAFSTTTSVSIKPAHSTKYDVCIKVKDAKGTVEKKYFTLTVKAATTALTNNSTISATSITLGSSITAKGAATGGTSPYQYAYYYKKTADTKWTEKKDFSTTTSVSIKPAHSTKYDVCIKVKDAKGTVEKKYFTLTVKAATTALTNNSTISATSITLGSSITAKGAAIGGTSPYQYAYYYKKTADTKWTEKKGFSTTTSVSIKPAHSTTYDVCIKVKDAKGTVEKKYFTLTVKSSSSTTLTNNSTISSTSLSYGQKVTISAKASGGTAPYTYTVKYLKMGTSNWTTLLNKSTTATTQFTPTSVGTYSVEVTVYDNNGKSVQKYLSFSVN